MKYSIDTSGILDCWFKYPQETFPSIWDNLDELIDQSKLIATIEVYIELEKKDDKVFDWAKKRKKMFSPIDHNIQVVVRSILQNHKKLIGMRKNPSSGADPFVIALAQINSCPVITGEKPSGSLSKPKIPDVCNELGIEYINILNLFQKQGWVF